MAAGDVATVWGEVAGRTITFPFEVTDLSMATLMFGVPADAAQALLPGDAFTVVETAPGRAQLVLAVCDYRENPWGDYDEVNFGFLVQPRTGGAIGSFVYRMPVNQQFTCLAGNAVMGFPKTVEDISIRYADDTVTLDLSMLGEPTLTLTMPRPAGAGSVGRVDAVTYSYLDGHPHATTLSTDIGGGVVDPAAVRIELGSGVVADELRTLGLPGAPDVAMWGEGLTATFQLGEPVSA